MSCDNDSFSDENIKTTEKNDVVKNVKLENGRLVFDSKQDFDNAIEDIKSYDEDERKDFFLEFYNNGFIPLYPYYESEIDDIRIDEYFNLKKNYIPNKYDIEDFSFSDPLIASDLFASLLNFKREIVIAEKIYCYTFQGLIIADLKNVNSLNHFIVENDAYKVEIDPTTLNPGINTHPQFPELEIWTNPDVFSNNGSCQAGPDSFNLSQGHNNNGMNHLTVYNPLDDYFCGGGGSYGSALTESEELAIFTDSMNDYIDSLNECSIESGNSWFGDNKICYEYFEGGKRRTRSKYFNNDYLIYAEIGMKVKHQRKRNAVFFTYWDRKKTDEVALIINQATYKKTAPNTIADLSIHDFNFPTNNNNGGLFYIGNSAYNAPMQLPYSGTPLPGSSLPNTPFDEDVIIQFFSTSDIPIVNQMDIDAEEIQEFFYENAYEAAKELFQTVSGGSKPRKFTMLINTENSVIVHYVDETRRHLNENVIVERLDSDLGGEISISLSVDEFNNIIADPSGLLNTSIYDFDTTDLMEYENVYVDFVGLSRRNNEWRGSSFVWYNN